MHPSERVRSNRLARAWLVGVAALWASCGTAAPNIILITADDSGYSDYGFSAAINNRTTVNETPNLDALAARSLVVTQSYVAGPVCGPSRAGLLTGQYQQRYGFEENLSTSIPESGDWGLGEEQSTIADQLKSLGYATGAIGKWHLGYTSGLNRPLDQGFDEFYGFLGGGRSYWSVGGIERGIHKNNQLYESQFRTEGDPSKYDPVNGRHITDAFGEEAVDYVNRHAGDEEPFFLYLPFSAPHTPYGAKQVDLDRFAHLTNSTQRNRAALIYSMDRAIGEVLGALEANGIEDDTIVMFMNDNGAPSNAGDNRPLRGHKGTTWEGGIRSPMIVSGPGISAGRYDAPITAYDVLPTFVAAAGGDAASLDTDGHNLLPQLTGQQTDNPNDLIFWRYFTSWAVRKGDWKLAIPTVNFTTPQLYNLALDPAELKTYNSQHRDVEAQLLSELTHWEATLDKPTWGALSTNSQNQFDHFTFRGASATSVNWSTAGNWFRENSSDVATLKRADAYANAVLEFQTRDDADYRATNDMRRMTGQTFMLHEVRLTGDFAGPSARRGTIDGNAVLMVKNRAGELPEIRLDATSGASPAAFTFQWDTEIQLLDDLRITGNGTEHFAINGRIRDYYEPGAPDDPTIKSPRSVTKSGTSKVTFGGDNSFGGPLVIEGGEVAVNGPTAAIRGAPQIIVAAGAKLTLEKGTIDVDTIDNSGGGAFSVRGGTLRAAHVRGNYSQSAGTLQLEIGGTQPGTQYDRLVVDGVASLAGMLDLRLTDSFLPAAGQSFELLTAEGGVDGEFEQVNFPKLPDHLAWNLFHEQAKVSLVVSPRGLRADPLVGDFNDDDLVDAVDYTVWRNSLNQIGDNLPADADGNGVVDAADHALWKRNYGKLLPHQRGDFNGDGLVDAVDYTVWRNSLGQFGSALAADANGDGGVNALDYRNWKSHYGEISPARRGDYNDDGVVDAVDYSVWRNSLGREGLALAADGNGDLRIDQADYVFWKQQYGNKLPGSGSGGLAGGGVPEPTTFAIGLFGGVCYSLFSRQPVFTFLNNDRRPAR
jgi:autotransporter-associated beta strand protein